MTQGHRHAQLALEYWTEAHGDEEAWRNWECKIPHGKMWMTLTSCPKFHDHIDYRRSPPKQRVIRIGDRLVPEPMRVEPDTNTPFFRVGVWEANTFYWDNTDWCKEILRKGICHLTKEAAQQHLDALIALNNQEVVEV